MSTVWGQRQDCRHIFGYNLSLFILLLSPPPLHYDLFLIVVRNLTRYAKNLTTLLIVVFVLVFVCPNVLRFLIAMKLIVFQPNTASSLRTRF